MKSRRDLKNLIAILVIIASFLVALGLAVLANNRANYWIATREMTPGHMVEQGDFKVVKAAFGKEANGYLASNQIPLGYQIARNVSAGEYLNQSALTDGKSSVKLLSFAVAAADLPATTKVGDEVNIYQVINENGDGKFQPSKLVIEGVFIVDLNRKSENLGGAAMVTVSVPVNFVEITLNATRQGRMVIVVNHG